MHPPVWPVLRNGVPTIPCVLNGKAVFSLQSVPVLSHNAQLVHHYSPLENACEHVYDVCTDAYAGFRKWSKVPVHDRSQIFMAAALLIEKNADLYVDAHRAIGGPESFARFCVDGAVANCRQYALQICNPPGLSVHSNSADMALTHQTPVGPVLAIAAWNAPTILWARAIMAPLAAGCSVVAKSSHKAPLPPYLLVQHLLQAGVEPQAVQFLQVQPGENKPVVDSLLADSRIRKINFTGSTAVGREIAVSAAQNLKPALLELGGKNVAVVCEDAHLRLAAANAIFSAWFHKGQVCMCLDTVYVHAKVYDAFIGILQEEAAKFAASPDITLNQRDAAAAEKVHALVDDAVAKGAKVLFGGLSREGPSNCSPVILKGVDGDMHLAAEESFGPVFSVEKFHNTDAIISHINDQTHGLKASVWSADILGAMDIARKLDFGGVHINGSTIHDEPTVPHGGVKESGSGRFNSRWGIEEFQYTKAITVSR